MRRIGGYLRSTGSVLYVCLGFIPDWVEIINCTTLAMLKWNRNMNRLLASEEGCTLLGSGPTFGLVTEGSGVAPFDPVIVNLDTPLTADSTVYHALYDENVQDDIKNWVLDTAGSRTGHFTNAAGTAVDVDSSYITDTYAGSRVVIKQNSNGKIIDTYVTALTADGDDTDGVEISIEATSGQVLFLGAPFTFRGMLSGQVPKQGFRLGAATSINDTTEALAIEAGTYDFSD